MTQAIAPASADAVMASLERLAERGVDPTAAAYERLFVLHPHFRARFADDADGVLKGKMLSRTLSAVLDFLSDPDAGRYGMATDMVTHEGYDIPRDAFAGFFAVVRDVTREGLGPDWTPTYEAGWSDLIAAIEGWLAQVP